MPRPHQFISFLAVMGLVGTALAQYPPPQPPHVCASYPPGTETTIAVYTNLDGTECAGTTANGMLTGSIWVEVGGAAAEGITGAEYRALLGNPECWLSATCWPESSPTIYFSPSPDALLEFGNPFVGGTNIVFDKCQVGPKIRLGTFVLIEARAYQEIALYVEEHESPSNYAFCCPLVTLCDGPVFTKVCATGIRVENDRENVVRECMQNPEMDCSELFYFAGVNMEGGWGRGRCPSQSADSPTATAEATWATVKSLYR